MDSDQENQFSLFRSQEKPKPWMLKVKIKTEEVEEDRIRPQCVCKVCNKGFSSGRALGGHMRVHADQAQVEAQPNKKVLVPTKLETKTTPTCSICGKYFLSMKSLFGHMRCHPERQWRGIQPPPKYDNHKEAEVEDLIDHSYDASCNSSSSGSGGDSSIENCLPRWTKTAKRGRKALTTTAAATCTTTTAPLMPEELRDVVQDLLRLARGCGTGESLGSGPSGLTQIKSEIEDMEDKNSKKEILWGSQIGYRVDCYYSLPVKKLKTDPTGKGKAVVETSEEEYDDGLDCETSKSKIINRNFETMIKRKRLMDLMDDQILQNPIDKFKCSICGKSFSTHQALGGHKSSHSKIRNIPTDKTHNIDHHDQSLSVVVEVETKRKEVSESSAHRCKICGKSFPTGQALGGHQRRHWLGPQAVVAPSSVTSSGETSRIGREILGFDLNELPPTEEEDENAAGYVNCASNYSFNSVAYRSHS